MGRERKKLIVMSEALEFRSKGTVEDLRRLKANTESFTTFPSTATSSLLVYFFVDLRLTFGSCIGSYGIMVGNLGSRTKLLSLESQHTYL